MARPQTIVLTFALALLAGGCAEHSREGRAGERIELGMTRAVALEAIERAEGVDITGGMALGSPEGAAATAPTGIYWEFPRHQSVLSVGFDQTGELRRLDYCPLAAFNTSKSARVETTRKVTQVVLHSDGAVSLRD